MKKYIYGCDAGCLVLVVNGARLMVGNGAGDGCYFVTIDRGSPVQGYDFTGMSIDGPVKVDVLDYDCQPSVVLTSIDISAGQGLYIYRKLGDIYLGIVGYGKESK